MKINLTCYSCTNPPNQMVRVPIRDDGYYKLKCENGHETEYQVSNQLYEILFDVGVNAIIDGYYREAIASFTASLERFYEFYIKFIWRKNNKTEELIDLSWKLISNQSERQLGAFVSLYMLEKNEAPKMLSNKLVELRNQVIHKGKIPLEEDVINYGNEIINLISPITYDIKENHHQEMIKTMIVRQMEAVKPSGKRSLNGGDLNTTLCLNMSHKLKQIDVRTAMINYKARGRAW